MSIVSQGIAELAHPRIVESEERNGDLNTTKCGCDTDGYSTDWIVRYGRFVHAIQG